MGNSILRAGHAQRGWPHALSTAALQHCLACRDGDVDSPWKPVCIVALRALEVETLGLTCTRLSFADPAASLQLLASSLLGDIISCSYAAAKTEVLDRDLRTPGVRHVGCISAKAFMHV